MVAPILYCIFWFSVWGGTGLRQSRQADELQVLGETYFNNSQYFQTGEESVCYDVPQEDLYINGTLVFTNYLKGITPVCNYESFAFSTFNVIYSFSYPEWFDNGMGPFISVLYLIAVAIYFCTSSDSGSLVVDFLASNGRQEHHWSQRLFWALTEGAVATALLQAGGGNGLSALQAASICTGLPFTVLLIFLMQTMYEFCVQAENYDQEFFDIHSRNHIKVPVYGGIFNAIEYAVSMGKVHPARVERGMDRPRSQEVIEFFKGLVVPFWSYYVFTSKFYTRPHQRYTNIISSVVYAVCFFSWIALFIATSSVTPLRAWGWIAYFVNGTMLGAVKVDFRNKRGLHGSAIGDFLCALFLFPQVFAQLVIEIQEVPFDDEKNVDDTSPHFEAEEVAPGYNEESKVDADDAEYMPKPPKKKVSEMSHIST